MHSSEVGFEKLREFIASMSQNELCRPFDFSHDEKKKEAHWKRDKNLRDILIHLYEWHNLLLNWVSSNRDGRSSPFLPNPYNWRTYGEMNVSFQQQHHSTSLQQAQQMLNKSHADVMRLAESFTDKQLFSKDAFPWVGSTTLGSYFVSVTASHYDWAIKKLKAHRKNCR